MRSTQPAHVYSSAAGSSSIHGVVQRLAEKKLPFYETKVLTLEVPGDLKVVSESLGGTGVTMRQHLRRGHIRRLANGNNIWINSYIAGSAAKGVITKSYNLVKS